MFLNRTQSVSYFSAHTSPALKQDIIMCERARRSRDSSSRYSIDTLFPGLSNNSTHARVSSHSTEPNGTSLLGLGLTAEVSTGDKVISNNPAPKKGNSKSGSGGRDLGLPRETPVNDNGLYLSNACPGPKTPSSRAPSTNSQTGNTRTKGSKGTPTPRNTTGPGPKKRAGSPLKPTTQPKQISLLSTTKMSRKGMQEVFQPWVLQTYGDSAKTKTITRKKYCRVVKTLRGEEVNNAENSKFRFWVKAKGFHIGPPAGYPKDESSYTSEPDLYVPTAVKVRTSLSFSFFFLYKNKTCFLLFFLSRFLKLLLFLTFLYCKRCISFRRYKASTHHHAMLLSKLVPTYHLFHKTFLMHLIRKKNEIIYNGKKILLFPVL